MAEDPEVDGAAGLTGAADRGSDLRVSGHEGWPHLDQLVSGPESGELGWALCRDCDDGQDGGPGAGDGEGGEDEEDGGHKEDVGEGTGEYDGQLLGP